MKKLKYAEEQTKNRIYIGMLLVVFIYGEIYSLYKLIQEQDVLSPRPLIFLILIAGCIIGLIYYTHQKKHYEKIKEKGMKVEATIEMPIEEYHVDMAGRTHYNYYIIVKYIDPETQKEVEHKTPKLGFNPYRYIKFEKCSVYLYEGEVYVSDYDVAVKKEESLWHSGLNDDTPVQPLIDTILSILLLILMFIVFMVLVTIMVI